MLGFYNYTVILTYAGMLAAFSGILAAVNGGQKAALVCLMLAGACDMFDGAVARTRKRTPAEKRLGIQIDSLSDLISFGVLPGMILYCQNRSLASAAAASLYVLCALVRLAYFNVMEEERQEQTDEARTCYMGLPVTTSAAILPAVYALKGWLGGGVIRMDLLALCAMALFFLLPVRVKKPHAAGKTWIALLGTAEFLLLAGSRWIFL